MQPPRKTFNLLECLIVLRENHAVVVIVLSVGVKRVKETTNRYKENTRLPKDKQQ